MSTAAPRILTLEHAPWYFDPAVHVAIGTYIIAGATVVAGAFTAIAARSAAETLRLEAEPAIVASKEHKRTIVPVAHYRIEGSEEHGFRITAATKDSETGFHPPNAPFILLSFLNTGRSPCVNFKANIAAQALPHGTIPYVIAETRIVIPLINPNYKQAILIVNATEPRLSPMHIALYPDATRTTAQDKIVRATLYGSSLMYRMSEGSQPPTKR